MWWASNEIAPRLATPLSTASTKASVCRNRNPPLPSTTPTNSQLPNPRPPPVRLFFFFFRSVAHGAEKIVFITCQHLAALSYATQDSIKLSYTGMKLQNRPGTSQQNYFIFFLKKRMEGVWLWGEGVTGKKWWWQTERVQHKDVRGDTIERQLREDTLGNCPSHPVCDKIKAGVLWSTKTSAGGQQFICFLLYINSFLFYFYLFIFFTSQHWYGEALKMHLGIELKKNVRALFIWYHVPYTKGHLQHLNGTWAHCFFVFTETVEYFWKLGFLTCLCACLCV